MARVLMSLLSMGLTIASVAAQVTGDTKAIALIQQARAALGGDSRLAAVHTLSCSGAFTRELDDRQLAGDLTIALQLPDKLLRTESMRAMGDFTVVSAVGINGDTLLRDQHAVNAPPGAMIRMGPPPTGEAEAQALRNARADMARTVFAFLLTSTPSLPVELSYAGEAEAADGRADVIDARGPGSFSVRLFLDRSTHRPLMLAYKGAAPQMRIVMQRGGPPPAGGHGDADRGGIGTAATPQIVDINLYLDDYKSVDGVWLPHHVSRSIDGKPAEEWTFSSFKVNPAFKPDTFAAR
jgi:hypothetical protein